VPFGQWSDPASRPTGPDARAYERVFARHATSQPNADALGPEAMHIAGSVALARSSSDGHPDQQVRTRAAHQWSPPVPVAFHAVVSIGVVGLYLAFAIPIFQRWRKGSAFKSGAWNLGRHYKWLCLIAVIEIGVTTVIAILPTSPGGVPWNPDFAWRFVNYTPLVVGGTLILLWLGWQFRAKRTYTGLGPRSICRPV